MRNVLMLVVMVFATIVGAHQGRAQQLLEQYQARLAVLIILVLWVPQIKSVKVGSVLSNYRCSSCQSFGRLN